MVYVNHGRTDEVEAKMHQQSITGSPRGSDCGFCDVFHPNSPMVSRKRPIQLVDYAPPSRPSHLHPSTNGTSVAETKIINSANPTSVDRWMIFESEYGIQDKSPSPIGRMLQAAKYGLDRVTFSAQESAKKLEFNCNIGDDPATGPGSRPCAPTLFDAPVWQIWHRADQVRSHHSRSPDR